MHHRWWLSLARRLPAYLDQQPAEPDSHPLSWPSLVRTTGLAQAAAHSPASFLASRVRSTRTKEPPPLFPSRACSCTTLVSGTRASASSGEKRKPRTLFPFVARPSASPLSSFFYLPRYLLFRPKRSSSPAKWLRLRRPLHPCHRNPRRKLRTSALTAPRPVPRPLWGPPAASQPPHLPYPSHGWWPRVHEHATPTIALVPWKLPALANPNGPPIRARPSPLPRHLPPVRRHRAPPSSLPSPPSKDAMAGMP